MRKRHTTRYPGIRYRLLDESRPDGPRRYVIGYTDANGRYHTETLGVGYTLEDARQRKAALEGQKGVFVPVTKTVGTLLDEYLDARAASLAPKTMEDYRYGAGVVKDYMGNRSLSKLTPNDVAGLIAKLKADGRKGWTIRKIMTPLVGALKVAVREGWIVSNPADRLLPHERPRSDQKDMRVLDESEIAALLNHAGSARWRSLFALLVFTGLRISEALALTWDDVQKDRVVVRTSKTDAGVREVMLVPFLYTALMKVAISQPPGTRVVFANRHGTAVSRREALRALRAAEERAGLPDYTLHELRHTFASILIAQGEPVTLVADQMGHADPSVTLKTYAKLFDAQKNVEAARQRLHATLGGMV